MAFGPHPGNQWLKMFTHMGHNLWLRHFVYRFHRENAGVAFLFFHPLLQFSFSLARSKDQNFISGTQVRENFIIIAGEISLIFPLP